MSAARPHQKCPRLAKSLLVEHHKIRQDHHRPDTPLHGSKHSVQILRMSITQFSPKQFTRPSQS